MALMVLLALTMRASMGWFDQHPAAFVWGSHALSVESMLVSLWAKNVA